MLCEGALQQLVLFNTASIHLFSFPCYEAPVWEYQSNRGEGRSTIQGAAYLQSPGLELFTSPVAPAGEFARIPDVSPQVSTASPSLSAIYAEYYGLTSHLAIQTAIFYSDGPQRLPIQQRMIVCSSRVADSSFGLIFSAVSRSNLV